MGRGGARRGGERCGRARRGADEVVNRYPITTLTDSDQSDEAKAFVEFITGPEGQKVLGDKDFGAP